MKRKRERPPSFQFYPKDFLADPNTRIMTFAERGVYIDLLSYCWIDGTISADLGELARLLQCEISFLETAWKTVGRCFCLDEKDGTRFYHKRLKLERVKQKLWRAKCSLGGKKSAGKRKHKKEIDGGKGSCDLLTRVVQLKGNTSSSSSIKRNTKEKREDEEEKPEPQISPKSESKIRFETFMQRYPKKIDRPAALIAWSRLQPDDEMLNQFLTAIDALKTTDNWTKDGGRWIPKAARFLEDRLWEEVVEEEERFYPGHEAPWNVAGLTPEESRRIAAEYAAKKNRTPKQTYPTAR